MCSGLQRLIHFPKRLVDPFDSLVAVPAKRSGCPSQKRSRLLQQIRSAADVGHGFVLLLRRHNAGRARKRPSCRPRHKRYGKSAHNQKSGNLILHRKSSKVYLNLVPGESRPTTHVKPQDRLSNNNFNPPASFRETYQKVQF
jgi:hypothetical protein